jgi:protein O-mannosyl-transferase
MFPESLPSLPPRRFLLLIAALFTGLMLLTYGKSLSNEFVRWDDGLLIYENPGVMEMTPSSLKRIFTTYDPELYVPLTLLTYQIDYQIAGPNPFIFHLENFLWHLLSALLVAWLAFLLIKKPWIACVVGLMFMLHPLHTEAVAWASGRKDVLSLFFFMASFIGYLYFRDGSQRAYLWSIAFFCIGLLCKGQILTLPVILILTDLFRGRKIGKEMFVEKWPHFALSVLFGIIGLLGKTRVVGATGTWEKIVMSFKSAMFYLEKLFWPDHFSLLYPYTKAVTLASPDFYIPFGVLVAIAAACVLLRKKLPELWFGFLFYYLVLSPTFLNFAKGTDMGVYSASDRYAYVASIGVFLFIGFILARIAGSSQACEKLAAGAVSLAMVAPLGFLAQRQSMVWKDTESLFENVIEHFPESSHVAHNNLGNMYRLRKDLDRSIEEYRKATAIQPHPKTYANLGGAYRQKKMYDSALEAYRQALLLKPDSKEAFFGRALVEAELGKRDEAKADYRKALEIDPNYEEVYTNLGVLLFAERDIDGAIAQYQKAIGINKWFADAQYNLAIAYSAKGDIDAAIDAYERTLRLAPRAIPAYINVGILYAKKGDTNASIRAFRKVLSIDPNNKTAAEALRQLGAQ